MSEALSSEGRPIRLGVSSCLLGNEVRSAMRFEKEVSS